MQKEYLSIEEQFKEILNNEEISRIQDPELRNIRMKHWEYRHRIFLDEHRISDAEFIRLSDEDYVNEKNEIEEYRKKKGI